MTVFIQLTLLAHLIDTKIQCLSQKKIRPTGVPRVFFAYGINDFVKISVGIVHLIEEKGAFATGQMPEIGN